MAYTRRYAFKGIYPLWNNVLRILERDMVAEFALIATDTGITLPPIAEFLRAEKEDATFPCVVVQPDQEDTVQSDDEYKSSEVAEVNIVDISIVTEPLDDLSLLSTYVVLYKLAFRNILWAAKQDDLLLGISASGAKWEVLGGRYTWVKPSNFYSRAVKDMKLVVEYSEAAVNG